MYQFATVANIFAFCFLCRDKLVCAVVCMMDFSGSVQSTVIQFLSGETSRWKLNNTSKASTERNSRKGYYFCRTTLDPRHMCPRRYRTCWKHLDNVHLKAPCYPDIFVLVIKHWKVNGTHVTRKWWALIKKKESISNARILHWSRPLIYYALGSLASISMEIVCRCHVTH